jgi:hypothetical protein
MKEGTQDRRLEFGLPLSASPLSAVIKHPAYFACTSMPSRSSVDPSSWLRVERDWL